MTSQAKVDSDALIGTLLDDKYYICEVLGRGASGTVFRGRHLMLDAEVAVKVLHEHLSKDAATRARFKREFITNATLVEHECIATVQSANESIDGGLYLVMDLIEGESLSTRMNRVGKLPIDEFFRIFADVLSGLSYGNSDEGLSRLGRRGGGSTVEAESAVSSHGATERADWSVSSLEETRNWIYGYNPRSLRASNRRSTAREIAAVRKSAPVSSAR